MNKNLLTIKTITVMKTEEKKVATGKRVATEKKVATEKGMDLLSLIFGYPSHEQCVINHKKAMGK